MGKLHMMPSLHHIAQALGGEVRAGQVLAPAPGHSPADRGMSIKLSDDAPDGFLVKLFNEGDPIAAKDYIRSKLGMPPWQPNGKGGNGYISPGKEMTRAAVELRNGKPAVSASSVPAAPASQPGPDTPSRVIATYPYVGADGELLYEVQRMEPKSFRQRRPLAGGGYAWNLGDMQPVLYRLPELLKFPDATVFLCEGEKDADRVASLDLTATTISGSTTWTPELAEPLRGRDVIILVDNDTPGTAKAEKAARALHGVAASVRLLLLPDLPSGGDISDYLDAGNSKEKLEQHCLSAPLFNPLAATPSPETLPFVDMSAWRVNEGVPPREWGLRDLFPLRNVALLSGEGAAGKTLLLLQLGVTHVLGKDWIGTLPEPGAFLYFGAEDETDEIHRRLADILKHYGADFPDLQGNLHLLTFAGEDAVLGHVDHTGLVRPTPLFERLMKAAIHIKPVLIGIDTAADVFAGNESDRSEVRQFVGMLRKLAIQSNAYVIVNSHPSLTGINTGSGLSGSTGWHNSVRARAYLTTVKIAKDEEPDPNLRTLEFKKNNYGPIAKSIALRWERGIYVPIGGIGSVDKLAKEHAADRLFTILLNRFNHQGRNVSEKAAARNYAPTMFGKEDEVKSHGLRKVDLEEALRRLFAAGQLAVQPYGPPSRGTTRLVTR
jgi:RecA-family ATPase